MTTPPSQSSAAWTSFRNTIEKARKTVTDFAKEIDEKPISRPMKIQKYKETIAQVGGMIESSLSFLSEDSKDRGGNCEDEVSGVRGRGSG